jgi:hypothetical protein
MNSFTGVVGGNLAKALEEVDKILRNPRTRVEIITLNRQMKTVTSELGKRALELYKGGRIQDPELAELCARIVGIEARIAEREARLAVQAQSGPKETEPAPESTPCPRCNTGLPEDAVFCHKCGLRLEEEDPSLVSQGEFCAHCGRELRPAAKFCPRCGSPA